MNNCIQAAFSSGGGGGATVTVSSDEATADETTTSSTFSDTALSLTCQSSGDFTVTASMNWALSVDTGCFFRFTDGTTDKARMQADLIVANNTYPWSMTITGTSDSQVINIEFATSGGTMTLFGVTNKTSRLEMMEVS